MIVDLNSLRAFVRVQKRVLTDDKKGGFREAWSDLGFVWAAIKPGVIRINGKSEFLSQRYGVKEPSAPLYEVIVRRETSLKPNMRLVWNDKILCVISQIAKETTAAYQKVLASEVPSSERGRMAHA